MFKNFIDSAYRDQDLDDALLWTLTRDALIEEYRLGGGERTIAKGYNEMWTTYARKCIAVSKELGYKEQARDEKEKKKKKKKEARKAAKEKAAAKPKAAEEAQKPKAEETKPAEGGGVEVADGGEDGKLPPVQAKPTDDDDKKLGTSKSALVSTGGFGGAGYLSGFGKQAEEKPKKKGLQLSRSMPSLACSLGGVRGAAVGHPSVFKLEEQFPLVKNALKHLEFRSPLVDRIDNRLEVKHHALVTSTEAFRASLEGLRAGDLKIDVPATPPPLTPRAQARQDKKDKAKMKAGNAKEEAEAKEKAARAEKRAAR